jgi:hypothetical protein
MNEESIRRMVVMLGTVPAQRDEESNRVWRQGCGKYLFPHQSPLSAAEFPPHSWRQRLGRIGREAQRAYIIINSLQTDM